MKIGLVILLLALVVAGCTTQSKARLKERNAFLAGQSAAWQQQQTPAAGVTVLGAVQNAAEPWVAGLTLAQAVATANYIGLHEPRQIILTRQGESAVLDAKILLNGAVVPLEPGDLIELR